MNAPADLKALERQRFIGGSDAAAILGVSPWATPLDLFLLKTGRKADTADAARERMFRRGKRLEPVVIDMLVEELGIKVTKRSHPEAPNRYTDRHLPFLAAEIDFEWEVTPEIAARHELDPALIGTIQNGEVKTVHPFASAKFGEADTDEIPVEYAAQAAHGMMITGRQLCMFGVLVGADNLSVYWLHRDEETIEGLRAKETAFWQYNVLADVAPAPVNLPDVMQLFRRKSPIRCAATPEIAALVAELNQLRATQRAAEQGQEELKFQIGEYMLGKGAVELTARGEAKPTVTAAPGDHQLLVDGEPVLEVRLQQQTRLDNDRIKREHPEVAAECSKSISFMTFNQPRKKGRK